MRKDVVGDWRTQFSPAARTVFERHAGCELILLGYEKNREWVKKGEKEDLAAGTGG